MSETRGAASGSTSSHAALATAAHTYSGHNRCNPASFPQRLSSSGPRETLYSPLNGTHSPEYHPDVSTSLDALIESELDAEALEDHLWSKVAISGCRPQSSDDVFRAVDGMLTSPTPGATHAYCAVTTTVQRPVKAFIPAHEVSQVDSEEFVMIDGNSFPTARNKKRKSARQVLAALNSAIPGFKLPTLKRKRTSTDPATAPPNAVVDFEPPQEPSPKRVCRRFEDYYTDGFDKTYVPPQATRGLIFGHGRRSMDCAPDVFGPDLLPERPPPNGRTARVYNSSPPGQVFQTCDGADTPFAKSLMQLALSSPASSRYLIEFPTQIQTEKPATDKLEFGRPEMGSDPVEVLLETIDKDSTTSLTPNRFSFSFDLPISPTWNLHDALVADIAVSPLSLGTGGIDLDYNDGLESLRAELPKSNDLSETWRTRVPSNANRSSVSTIPFPRMESPSARSIVLPTLDFSFASSPTGSAMVQDSHSVASPSKFTSSPRQWTPDRSLGSDPRAFIRPGNPTPSHAHGRIYNKSNDEADYRSFNDHGFASTSRRMRMDSGYSETGWSMDQDDSMNQTFSTACSDGLDTNPEHAPWSTRLRTFSDAEVEATIRHDDDDDQDMEVEDLFDPKLQPQLHAHHFSAAVSW